MMVGRSLTHRCRVDQIRRIVDTRHIDVTVWLRGAGPGMES